MMYLFAQMLFWLLAALIIGIIIGWYLRELFITQTDESDVILERGNENDSVDTEVIDPNWKPIGLAAVPADADNLKRVKGIGPVIEKTLNSLGIFTFNQVGNLTDNNVKWLENHISFPGRIYREEWVKQAKLLAEGKPTDFSRRVDVGDVQYD